MKFFGVNTVDISMIELSGVRCFVIDMDGTIYLGDHVIPGAHELLRLFDEKQIPYYFFTNNSSKSPDIYFKKFEKLGFRKYNRESIITSGDVTADYVVNTYGSNAKAYVVGTEPLIKQLMRAGIICTDAGTPDCLIVGFDTSLRYEKLIRAVELLRAGIPFLATNIDAVCPLEGGAVLPDCGSICAMLTHATGVNPKYIGKPFPETAVYIQSITNTPACRTGIIGDRLYTDMRFAIDNGMCAIGVLSGEMTRKDIAISGMSLQYLFDSVLGLYELLNKLNI